MKGHVRVAIKQHLDISKVWTDGRRALDQVVQMMTGGLVIQSTWYTDDARPSIYAQTVIQLDGDVVMAYHPDMIARTDCEALAARHMDAVTAEMRPLRQLSLHLARVRYICLSAGTAGVLVSGTAAVRSFDWTYMLGLLAFSVLAAGGAALRRLLLMLIRRRVRHLLR